MSEGDKYKTADLRCSRRWFAEHHREKSNHIYPTGWASHDIGHSSTLTLTSKTESSNARQAVDCGAAETLHVFIIPINEDPNDPAFKHVIWH